MEKVTYGQSVEKGDIVEINTSPIQYDGTIIDYCEIPNTPDF